MGVYSPSRPPLSLFQGGYHGLGVDHDLLVELVHDLKLLLLELDLASRECINTFEYFIVNRIFLYEDP